MNPRHRVPLDVSLACEHRVTLSVYRKGPVAKGETDAVTCPTCYEPTRIIERHP